MTTFKIGNIVIHATQDHTMRVISVYDDGRVYCEWTEFTSAKSDVFTTMRLILVRDK